MVLAAKYGLTDEMRCSEGIGGWNLTPAGLTEWKTSGRTRASPRPHHTSVGVVSLLIMEGLWDTSLISWPRPLVSAVYSCSLSNGGTLTAIERIHVVEPKGWHMKFVSSCSGEGAQLLRVRADEGQINTCTLTNGTT